MHERVGPWSGSRGETRWFSAVGARRHLSSRGGRPVRDRAGRDCGAWRHGVRRHPRHPPRCVLGRGIRDRSRRSGMRAGSGRLDWSALARFPGTLVVYMGVTHLAAICRTLIRHGKPGDTPAAVIESGTLPSQVTDGSARWRPLLDIAQRRATAAPCSSDRRISRRACDRIWNGSNNLPLFGQRIVDHPTPTQDASRGGGARDPWVRKCSWRRRSK